MSMKVEAPQAGRADDPHIEHAPIEQAPPSRAVRPRMPKWLTGVLALTILVGGIAAAVILVKTKKDPPKKPTTAIAPLVEVVEVSSGTRQVSMQLQGEVSPSAQVVVMPEVTGKVVWQSDQLVPGGKLEEGEPILRIDPSDYALNLRQQQSQLAANRLQLDLEEGRARVATEEWELFQEERKKSGLPASKVNGKALATREPHVESAKVAMQSAKSSIQRAALQLDRTTIKAPFNAIVRTESVDRGQVVSPGMQLATLVGTDTYWVRVSIPMDQLAYVQFPEGETPGSRVKVWTDAGQGRIEREGRVIRLLSDLDPVGRLARILVEVDHPLDRKAPEKEPTDTDDEASDQSKASHLPLLLGSFVKVEVEGVEVSGLTEIPRKALQENNNVYILDEDGKLHITKVEVVWGDREVVLVTGDVKSGDRLITSVLNTAVEGMALRAIDDAADAVEEDAPAPTEKED